MTHLHDWIAETPGSIAARLEGAREAQRQTRTTLLVLAVISMMMLILSYNAYLSFDSRWTTARAWNTQLPLDGMTTVSEILTVRALEDWAASRNAAIELLGITVSVDDAPVLGTTSLFVVSLWLLLVTRRENHTVGSLLRDTDTVRQGPGLRVVGGSEEPDGSMGQRWLIFHTIIAGSLFVTFDRSLTRIDTLGGVNRLMPRALDGVRAAVARHAMSFARDFFFWFPVAAATSVFCLDRLSYFQPDPFQPGVAPPGPDAPLFVLSAAVFVVCWIPLLISCFGAARFSRATERVLRDYGARLQADLVAPESRRAAV